MLQRLLLVFALFGFGFGYSQNVNLVPEIEPSFFSADDEITISYDVTGTALASLPEAWIWLWVPREGEAPLNAPSNINPASSNSAGTNPAKFTKTNPSDKTVFTITLTLTSFTGMDKESIKRIGMLLKGNDWSNGQTTDYFVDVTDGFALKVDSPIGLFGFYQPGQMINIDASTSNPADFEFFIDEVLDESELGITNFQTTHQVIDDGETHQLKINATFEDETQSFVYSYITNPQTPTVPLPAGLNDGINYHADSVSATLVLVAPNKSNVFVLGDFNNWTLDKDFIMNNDNDRFWLKIDDLEKGKEYIFQYLVDGSIRIGDPYAEKVSSPYDDAQIIEENRYPGLLPYPAEFASHEASYLQTSQPQFTWEAQDYVRPKKEDLVIYELLIRDFTDLRTFQAVIDKMDYLESLGVNAIELLPVMEFEGNISWGYNPSFMFAVDKFYGTENKLRDLIDEAHSRGMAIILDIVLNHVFGRSPLVRLDNDAPYGAPTLENVWLNRVARHDFNVGYDFNHESDYTKQYVDDVVTYWIENYNIDGYRFDLSKGFTQENTLGNIGLWNQYDASRVALLKRMADVIWETDPDNYVMLEHFADNNEERELANYGMMLWGNMHGAYINAARGQTVPLDWAYHKSRGWNEPHLIAYMESHDEERTLWELKKTSNDPLDYQIQRLALNSVFFFMIPGPKMLWQFGEFGYDEELNNDRLGIKPTRWEYLEVPTRKKLFDLYSSMIKLKTRTSYLNDGNFEWEAGGTTKYMWFDNPDVKISVVGNFSNETRRVTGRFINTGTWHDYFSRDEIVVSNTGQELNLKPGEFRIFTSQPIDNYLDNGYEYVLGIDSRITHDIDLYPNPANREINIGINNPGTWVEEVFITDLNGKRVYFSDDRFYGNKNLDITSLEQGMYIITLVYKDGVNNKRLIKN